MTDHTNTDAEQRIAELEAENEALKERIVEIERQVDRNTFMHNVNSVTVQQLWDLQQVTPGQADELGLVTEYVEAEHRVANPLYDRGGDGE